AGLFLDLAGDRFLADRFSRVGGEWRPTQNGVPIPEGEWTSPFVPYRLSTGESNAPQKIFTVEENRRSQVRLLGPISKIIPGDWGEGSDPVLAPGGIYLSVLTNARSRIYFYDFEKNHFSLISPPEKRAHFFQATYWKAGGMLFFSGVSYLDPGHPENGFIERLFFKKGQDSLRAFPLSISEDMKLRPFKVSGDGEGKFFAHTSEILPMANAAVFCDLQDYPFPFPTGTNGGRDVMTPLPRGACLAVFPGLDKLHSLAFNPFKPGEVFLVGTGKGRRVDQLFQAHFEMKRSHLYRIRRIQFFAFVLLSLAGLALLVLWIRNLRGGERA
ncbi:MAG: hypothetical protein JNM63_01230, partial [Spirochaetia bacterium]|nr:hypothetical protein [Spirochaetia bacterium]